MNVWDETWSALSIEVSVGPYDGQNEARDQLASAAPDMARVLLALEWTQDYRDDVRSCPVCGGWETGGLNAGHEKNCTLDAALRKAGVR